MTTLVLDAPLADIVAGVDGPDALLAARLCAGDADALTDAYARHGALVYGLARRVADAATAEDVTQEIFVSLWEHPDRFDPARGTLRAFLGVQAQRRAVDALRRDGRRAGREQRHHDEDPERPRDPVDDLVLRETVRGALDTLPPEQRAVVELAYVEGRTLCEIASCLGIPEGTAKSRLRLAQGKLAPLLRTQLEESR
jgi:RNA polymerase sigma-70 factor (ECF subfamily)